MNPYFDAVVPAIVVFSITCLIFGFAAFKHYLKHKERLSSKKSTLDTEELELKMMNLEKLVRDLSKRTEALETIITRDEYDLNRKFKEL